MINGLASMIHRLTCAGLDPFSMNLRQCLAAYDALQEMDRRGWVVAFQAQRREAEA